MIASDCGVLFITWGSCQYDKDIPISVPLNRSIASLKKHMFGLPVTHIHLDKEVDYSTHLKSKMWDLSPYDITLFLDADTVVLDDLYYGFVQAKNHGIACPICSCPHQNRYKGQPEGVEYCTSSLFFDKTNKRVKPIFLRYLANCLDDKFDSKIYWTRQGKELISSPQDQGCFGEAMHYYCFNPFVLPINWNWSPEYYQSYFGKLKVRHSYSDVPDAILKHNPTAQPMDYVKLG